MVFDEEGNIFLRSVNRLRIQSLQRRNVKSKFENHVCMVSNPTKSSCSHVVHAMMTSHRQKAHTSETPRISHKTRTHIYIHTYTKYT